MADLRSLVKQEDQVRFYAISVDSPAESKSFAEQIAADGKGEVNFPILSDPAHRVIDAYGIRDSAYNGQKFEGIPHATVYIINRDGRVAWTLVETDYKLRPNNQEVSAALKNLRGSSGKSTRVLTSQRKLLINTTSLATMPRATRSCLPSRDQSNEKMRSALNVVSCLGSPPLIA